VLFKFLLMSGAAAVGLAASAAAAQDVGSKAEDAFGRRIGLEQTGLYSETSARGFDLTNSNAYRIEGAYFGRAAPLSDAVVKGVAVKVGVVAARSGTPSPSGVVDYDLREATRNGLILSGGWREYASPFLEASMARVDQQGRWGVNLAVLGQPALTFADGVTGAYLDYGAVVHLAPAQGLKAVAFVSCAERAYTGNYGFKPSGPTLPAPLPNGENLAPPWADFSVTQTNAGILTKAALAQNLELSGSLTRSELFVDRSDFTLFSLVDRTTADAVVIRSPSRSTLFESAEVRLRQIWLGEGATHQLEASVRAGRRLSAALPGKPVALGLVDLTAPQHPGETDFDFPAARNRDRLTQHAAVLAYTAVTGPLELRAGLQRAWILRGTVPVTGAPGNTSERYWLPYASVVWSPSPDSLWFASYVSGLEESGVAPQTATNANAPLPSVEARQLEVGVRRVFGPFQATATAFSISKPVPGLRADGSYGFLGDVSHRGVEASLAATLGRSRLLAGATVLDAEVGETGRRPAGVAERSGFIRWEHAFGPSWSVDAQANHVGPRAADPANIVTVADYTLFNLGLRHRRTVAGVPIEIRALASNVAGENAWVAGQNGFLVRTPPPAVRLTLTARFE